MSVLELPTGSWRPSQHLVDGRTVLIRVLEGLLVRDLLLAETVASELLGPGDVVALEGEDDGTLIQRAAWTVAGTARLTIIDVEAAAQAPGWARASRALLDGVTEQLRRNSELIAIGHLPRVEDRALAVLWHLAERYGHVAPDGIVVPLDLTHAFLGRLMGARRPTVSLALKHLDDAGHVSRRDDGSWLLSRDSVNALRRRDAPVADGAGRSHGPRLPSRLQRDRLTPAIVATDGG